jgi:hypothetical protein
MGDLQIRKQSKNMMQLSSDPGAGGGMAAHVYNAGLKFVSSKPVDVRSKTDSNQLKNPWESPQGWNKFRPFGDFDGCYWGWK